MNIYFPRWNWAMKNPDATVDIIMKYDNLKWYDRSYHLHQVKEVNKLLSLNNGRLNINSYKRTLRLMNKTAPTTFTRNDIWGAAFS